MAVRSPLWYNSGNLQEMTAAEIVQWQQKMQLIYATNPTSVLTQVSSSGALIAAMSDTRTSAGAVSQSTTAFVAEGTTAEPGAVTVSFDKINLAYVTSGVGQTADAGTTFPVYYDNDSNTIAAMSLTDVLDTFVYPAIVTMVSGTESAATAGTYTITTSATAATNYTQVSSTAVFIDTRADTSAYSSAGIPETVDQPSTITSYFLHERDGVAITPDRTPIYIDGNNNLKEYTIDAAATLLGNWLRYTAATSTAGYKISYNVGTSGTGNTRGSAMVNTKLDGTGNYQTRQVSDDYRSQEFPNGSVQTISTYNLRITYS